MILTGLSSFKDFFDRKVSVVRWSSHPGKINPFHNIPGSWESFWAVCDSFAVCDSEEGVLALRFLVCKFVTHCLGTACFIAFAGARVPLEDEIFIGPKWKNLFFLLIGHSVKCWIPKEKFPLDCWIPYLTYLIFRGRYWDILTSWLKK